MKGLFETSIGPLRSSARACLCHLLNLNPCLPCINAMLARVAHRTTCCHDLLKEHNHGGNISRISSIWQLQPKIWTWVPKRGKSHQRFYPPHHCVDTWSKYQHVNISSINPVHSEICLTIISIFNVHCVAYIVPPKKESVKCNFVHNCTQKKRPSVTARPHPRKMSSSRQFHPGQNAINFVYDFFQCQTGGPFLSMPACSFAAF